MCEEATQLPNDQIYKERDDKEEEDDELT